MFNTNKFLAFKQTLGFFAIAAVAATVFVYGTMFIPVEYVVYTFIFGLLAFGFWLMYTVNLEKLERAEKKDER